MRRSFKFTIIAFLLLPLAAMAQNTDWHTGDGPYSISNAEQLKGLAQLVNAGNDFAGKTVKLTANITINSDASWGTYSWANATDVPNAENLEIWTPIGTSANPSQFKGTFDGNGYVVKGIYIPAIAANQGLFGYVGTGGAIKNVGLVSSYIKGGDPTGALVGRNYGVVSNSFSLKNVVVISGYSDAGGLVGSNNGTIDNCYAVSRISTGSYTGGVTGSVSGTVKNGYYDSDYLGRTTNTGRGVNKTTSEMQAQSFVTDLNYNAGILEMNEWKLNDGDYPTLLNGKIADDPLTSVFASGDGSETNPYIINTKDQLESLASTVNQGVSVQGKFLKLGQNINLAGSESDQWVPIGASSASSFQGTFDGDGKTISGIFIKGTAVNQGLFGYTGANSTIKNLSVSGEVEGGYYTGGLVGYSTGTIRNCNSAVTVKGTQYTGGLVGSNENGNIYESHATGNVTGTIYVGGLAGRNYSGSAEIDNCYATGTISGTSTVGGLVGDNSRPIKNSYAIGAVTGTGNYVGGLAGDVVSQSISNSYATGAVNGANNVGGLAGRVYGTGSMINSSYAIGKVIGTGTDVGGLIGLYNNTCISCFINKSFYDTQTTEKNDDGKGEGKTTAEMQNSALVAEMNVIAGVLDLKAWIHNSGNYPTLGAGNASFNLSTYFASGNGTESNPYIISTRKQMEDLSLFVSLGKDFRDQYIKLGTNIELNDNAKVSWQSWGTTAPSNAWTPIGSDKYTFKGTFDGNGKTISGIYINASGDKQGLFGYADVTATIKNLGVTNS
jgi:hypothetical protein